MNILISRFGRKRLKVTIRGLLTVLALLGAFFIDIGRAHAVVGVADDVLGQDIVFPIICEGHHDPSGGNPIFGSLNTLWAIADHAPFTDEVCLLGDSACTPQGGGVGVVHDSVTVFDSTSAHRLDTGECWTKNDIISNNCQSLISSMSTQDQEAMEVTIGGRTYFAGYVLYSQDETCVNGFQNRFAAWVYLNDIVKGFAAGFNGISLENGAGPQLEETCKGGSCSGDVVAVEASTVFPRYFLLNGDPDSFNWWIFLLGSNLSNRALSCVFCDEEEHCFSGGIGIPFELNIINVASIIPSALFPPLTFPKAGFASCDIGETGVSSLFGWSYQRAVPVSSPARISVVHPIHRE